jgi:hypothetical protein
MSDNEITENPLIAKFPDLRDTLEKIGWVDTGFDKVEAGKSAFAILGEYGDTKHIWDKDKEEEVEAARTLFDSLTKKGYRAFKVTGKNGDKGDIMKKFDPEAERVIFAPMMQGG